MTILVTGAAGFIGFHVTSRLLQLKIPVIGFDNFNDYYDPFLKNSRNQELQKISSKNSTPFSMVHANLQDNDSIKKVFNGKGIDGISLNTGTPSKVIHLAAQAGVRYSISNPGAYIESNLVGFGNILEACRHNSIEHLIYASSSSVYGGNTKLPFREKDNVDHPVSLYAATKKSNELMAHTYSHLYNLPSTGLRFFTVYGPWGRPDMALFLFTEAIYKGTEIKVFNHGNMIRDFTYIDDIVESIVRLKDKAPKANNTNTLENLDPSKSWAPYRVFNIGNSSPTPLMEYIKAIENETGKKGKLVMEEIQPGDVPATSADTSSLEEWINFKPKTSISDGIKEFVTWYKNFYKIAT